MKTQFFQSRISLILLGIGLGWLARIVLGAPAEDLGPLRTIDRPIESTREEVIDIPIIHSDSADEDSDQIESGLVPPIQLPGSFTMFETASASEQVRLSGVLFEDYSHDESAAFEAHGEQLCASGCAVSRHPTKNLTKYKFNQLLKRYANGPLEETNKSLEELVYFGPQTRRLIESEGVGELAKEHATFLWDQLAFTHAKISIRVKDEQGEIRTWIEPTRVPFDRRHVFDMKTNNVQPLVTSGTVKRVGLNHLWTRL